ncbi:MAG: hypothetical protein J6M47_11365 [Clostridia bacterium]|nr:hypothetical protein [Clostridia bacterium]
MGHREMPEHIDDKLIHQIECCIRMGAEEFYFGDHGDYDACVIRALKEMKTRYPHMNRILVIPYHPAVYRCREGIEYDEMLYPFEKPIPPRYAIDRANRWMIRSCDALIAYVCKRGKAYTYLRLAEHKQKLGKMVIVNLADGEP